MAGAKQVKEEELFAEICKLVGILQGREFSSFTMCVHQGKNQAAEITIEIPGVLKQYRNGWHLGLKFDSYVPGYTASKQDIIDRLRAYIESKD